MIALFDRHSQLVAWLGDEGYIFSKSLNWIAFVAGNYVFDVNCGWLGGFVEDRVH